MHLIGERVLKESGGMALRAAGQLPASTKYLSPLAHFTRIAPNNQLLTTFRSSRRKIFPEGVRGTASTKLTCRGCL